MKTDLKKIIKLTIQIIFLLGTIYGLSIFVRVAETINLSIPF
jgi:hypothetical protein